MVQGNIDRDATSSLTYNVSVARKNAGAIAPGIKGPKRGGPAPAEKLASRHRSEGASKARLTEDKGLNGEIISSLKNSATREKASEPALDTSDQALAALLNRLKATVDPAEVRRLSDQIERIIFHKQFTNA